MSWVFLAVAILFEVAGTTSMKLAEGFTRLLPSILIFVFYGLSFAALTVALRRIDLSVAYAIWSGLGTALIAVIALLWFGEAMPPVKVVSLALVILGVVGLQLT
ncbi:MAG: multidrug efflux SMR transporter [Alphaproteobacteria bacterium]|nr:multidrug efflux SMR transporter [Alphaproteobacteria bacterium]